VKTDRNMDGNTSIPLVVIGVGALVSLYNPANLRLVGFVTIALGIGMLFVKRS
tara:strand:- start:445 stop:603 length:159 start_codon:yes stop_codon:yes gene_type:complete